MELEELKKKSNLKVLFEGESGRGKTLNSCKVVVDVLSEGYSVKYVDTETEGSETLVNVVEDSDHDDDVVENLDYVQVSTYESLKSEVSNGEDYDLLVIDTLDHKHSYVLKAVTDAKREADAEWNEFTKIYSEEKEFMKMVNDLSTNVIATIDPESGKSSKPKGAQTNVQGYFGVVVELRKNGDSDWDHKNLNWIGQSNWIGKAHPAFPKNVSKRIIERC